MRGKHGKAAAVRHEVADLEVRAVKAEQRVAKVMADYMALKQRYESETQSLRAEVAAARKDRDEQVSPRLIEAERRVFELVQAAERHELALASAKQATTFAVREAKRATVEALIAAGFSEEQIAAVHETVGDGVLNGILGLAARRQAEAKSLRDLSGQPG